VPPVDITQKTIAAARAKAKPGASRFEITDRRARGLILRGGPQGVVWQHRCERLGKTYRLTLGGVDRWTIDEARQIAEAATSHVRTFGNPPDEAWLQGYLVEIGKLAAPAPENDPAMAGFPTFAIARGEYLEDLARRSRKATVDSYRGFLCMPEVAALDDRIVATVTRDEVFQIILAVHASGRESSAENLTRTIRPFFNWMGGDGRRLRYGVQPGLLVGMKPPERTLVETHEDDEDDDAGTYVPPLSELGRIMAIARSGALPPVVACAVELTCWVVQRRRAIAEARMSDFLAIEKPGPDGTINISEGLWRVPPASRKTRTKSGAKKKPHVIPLPPQAWACVMRAAALAHERNPETRFLFPAKRPRRAGDEVGAMSPSTLTHAFIDLPDCGASPHDVRRTMATDGEALLGLDRKETKAILDHAEGAAERVLKRSSAGDVTDIHYSFHDGTHFTWPIMRAWCDALEREIEIATAALEPVDEIMRKLGDRSYRIGAPPVPEIEDAGPEIVGVLRPLRPADDGDE
jgi:hypothetical protein